MLEPEFCASRVPLPFREESGDEELSVLPRHTKVVVTGNNRTKSVLVGLQGVVKKAVGLGGWHWLGHREDAAIGVIGILVLKNGVEVKLQRNALSVLEHPTGNEGDSHDFDNSTCSSDIGEKERDISRNMVFPKLSKSKFRHAKPWFPSTSSKFTGRASYPEGHSVHMPQLGVNLAKLGTDSLWKYCRRFNLANGLSNTSREHILIAVQHHFEFQVAVLTEFIRVAAAKRCRLG